MSIKAIFRFFSCLPQEEEKVETDNKTIKKINYINISFDKPVTMSEEEYSNLNIQILKQKNDAVEGTSPNYKNDSYFKAAHVGNSWLVKRCRVKNTDS